MTDESEEPFPTSGDVASTVSSVVQCGNCGAEVTGLKFCSECGRSTAVVQESQRPSGDIVVGSIDSTGRIRASRKGVVMVTLLVLVVAGGAIGAWAFLRGGGTSTHTITGDMTLHDAGSFSSTDGKPCLGSGGYSDMSPGANVKVSNQSGTLIGSSTLDLGKTKNGECVFTFTVKDVKNSDFYSIEISHRGSLSFSKAEMEANGYTVHSTLGH